MTPKFPLPFAGPPGRLRAAWRFFLFVLLYVLFVSAWMMMGLLLLPASPPTVSLQFVLFSVIVGLLAVAMATGFMLRAVDHRPLSFVGLGGEPGWLSQLAGGFLLGLAMIGGVALLQWATGHLRVIPSGVSAAEGVARLLLFFFVFLAGAVHEELLARGYPFQRLLEVLGTPAAVLVQGAIFAALHYSNPGASLVGTVNTMLVGILFAVAYLRTGRLWLPIGLHWGWNFFEAAFGFPVSGIKIGCGPLLAEVSGAELLHGGGYGPEASVPATLAILAVIVALILRGGQSQTPARSSEVQ